MTTPPTDVELCNAALIKVGASRIAAFGTASLEAEVAATLYPIARDNALSAHPWSFTLRRGSLERLTTKPLADFNRGFRLPTDFLTALYIENRGSSPRYALVGQELQTDSDTVVLTYQARIAEADFPPYFRAALVAKLAAEFCLPITENSSRAEALDHLAERELERAWRIDRSQESPPVVKDDLLTRVRG